MRHFLAAYKFELEDKNLQDLSSALNSLNIGFKNKDNKQFIKVDAVSSAKDGIYDYLFSNFSYGIYGEDMEVHDILSGAKTYDINKNESALDSYFYMFYFINSYKGYALLERIGNIGIRTLAEESINSTIKNGKIIFHPIVFGINEVLKNPPVKLTVRIPNVTKEAIIDQFDFGVNNINNTEFDMVFLAKKGKKLDLNWLQPLKEAFSSNKPVNLAEINKNFQNKIVELQVKIGKSHRTISLNKERVRTWIEIKEEENKKDKALEIIEEIKNEFRNASGTDIVLK